MIEEYTIQLTGQELEIIGQQLASGQYSLDAGRFVSELLAKLQSQIEKQQQLQIPNDPEPPQDG